MEGKQQQNIKTTGADRVVCEVHPAHLFRVGFAAIIRFEVGVNVSKKGGVLVALAVVKIALDLSDGLDLRGETHEARPRHVAATLAPCQARSSRNFQRSLISRAAA